MRTIPAAEWTGSPGPEVIHVFVGPDEVCIYEQGEEAEVEVRMLGTIAPVGTLSSMVNTVVDAVTGLFKGGASGTYG